VRLAARRVIATAPRVVEGPFGVVHGGCMVTDHVAGGGEMVVVRPGHRRLAEAFNRLLMAQQQGEVLLETSKEEQRNVLTKNDLVAPALANPGQQALDMDQGFTQGGCRLGVREPPAGLFSRSTEIVDRTLRVLGPGVMVREPVIGFLEA